MTDIDPNHPLVTELADARERVAVLEQRLEEQQARNLTPEEREDAAQRTEGERVLNAYKRGRDKNTTKTRINNGTTQSKESAPHIGPRAHR